MFTAAFSGFSVNDLDQAKAFYTEKLGLQVEQESMGDGSPMGLQLHLPQGGKVFVYAKEDHTPATFTILNFVVTNIDEAVDSLLEKGIQLEKYEGMHQDEKGITRGLAANMGPDIAWFKDTSGNILSVLQEK